jgi:hypothetical protein
LDLPKIPAFGIHKLGPLFKSGMADLFSYENHLQLIDADLADDELEFLPRYTELTNLNFSGNR